MPNLTKNSHLLSLYMIFISKQIINWCFKNPSHLFVAKLWFQAALWRQSALLLLRICTWKLLLEKRFPGLGPGWFPTICCFHFEIRAVQHFFDRTWIQSLNTHLVKVSEKKNIPQDKVPRIQDVPQVSAAEILVIRVQLRGFPDPGFSQSVLWERKIKPSLTKPSLTPTSALI